jgi:hypothetical protein
MAVLQEYKGKFHVNLPSNLVEKKKWKKGEKLIWSFNERGNLELTDTK